MVENKQSAVGGYYSDVKSPKRVYTELDTLIPYLLLVEGCLPKNIFQVFKETLLAVASLSPMLRYCSCFICITPLILLYPPRQVGRKTD